MFNLYSLIKVVAPSATVGVLNLITYLGFTIHKNKQISNRNYRIQKHFQSVKGRVVNNLINDNSNLVGLKYGAIEKYFIRGNPNDIFLKGRGGEKLLSEWKKIAPDGTRVTLEAAKSNNFFQEVRYYCLDNKDSADVKLLVAISELCSSELVTEKDFEFKDS